MHDQWYLVWKENNRLKIMVSQKKKPFVSGNSLKESLGGKKKKKRNQFSSMHEEKKVYRTSLYIWKVTTTRLLESRTYGI